MKKTSLVSWIVFFVSLAVAIPSVLSFLFPALIVSITTLTPDETVNPFELGVLFYPFFTANLLLLGFSLLYSSEKLPSLIQRSIKFIFNFEVSQRVSLSVILILLTIYVVFSFYELEEPEIWGDYITVLAVLEGWPFDNVYDIQGFNLHVKYFLLYLSENIFQNHKAVPFIASILLLFLTYLFTVQLTKKRFAGLVAMTIVLQSYTFLKYDTTSSYANFHTLFYILSLYLISKKWHFSPFIYVLSIFSKAVTLMFLPMTFFFTYRAPISKKQKIYTAISYGVIIIIGVIVALALGITLEDFQSEGILPKEFWTGFASIGFSLRFDGLFLIFLIPLIFGLFMTSRKGMKQADAVLFLIMGVILSIPVASFFGMTNQPYRLIPFIIFFAVGVGTLLSGKLANRPQESP